MIGSVWIDLLGRMYKGRPPSDAIAVLMALHAARPTEDLLSFGAWEATHEKSVYR